MLLAIALSMFTKVVALTNADLQRSMDLWDWDGQGEGYSAVSCCSLQVGSVPDLPWVIFKEQSVYLSPSYPNQSFRQEGDAA